MAEKSIFGSENLFKELFYNMSSGVAIYEALNNGEDFIFKEFNTAGEKINNLKRDDIIGKNLTEIFPGVKELGLFEVLKRVWKTGNAETHPTSLYRDERITLWVQNYVFKLPSGNVVAIFDDITANKKIEKALETSVEEYRLLVENAQSAIFYLGLDYKISSWNKIAEEIYGWKKSEAIGKTIDELIPVEFPYDTREDVEKIFFEKGVWKGEAIQHHKNGTPINVLSSSIIIKDDDGNPKGMVTINHDITELHIAQQKLFDSELRFKSIFMDSPIAISLYDSNGKLIDANKACLDLINISDVDQVRGFDILDDPNMPRDIKTRILKGETVKFEVLYDFDKVEESLRAGRAGVLYFDAMISPIYSEDRESVKYYLNQVNNITERRLGEKRLEESEERFRKIFEEGPLGMAIINLDDYSILKVNTMLCTMLEYTENELTALKIQDITHPDDNDKDMELVEQIVRGDISFFTLEKRYFKKNNEILWGNLTSSIIRDKDGNVLYGLGMIEDISERKIAEQKLKESEQNLKKSQKELLIRNQISKIFLTILDDEMYAEVLDIILKALKSKYGVFGYLDEDGSSVCPSMTRNIYDKCQMENKTIVFPRETWGGIWATSMIEKRIICSNGPFNFPKGHVLLSSALVVPIILQDECLGHILVGNKEGGYYKEDIDLLESIADWTAPILHARLKRKIAEEKLRKLNEELELRVERRTKELEESQRDYRNFLQNFEGIAFHGDLDFNFTFIQGSFELITGYKPEEILSGAIKWNQIMIPQDKEKFINKIKQFREIPNTHFQHEYQIKCKDDTIKWVKEIVRNISNESGTPFMVQGAIYDITEQKKFDEILKESEEKFRSITEQSLMGIIIIQNGKIKYVNEAFGIINEYSVQEMLDWPQNGFIKIVHPDDVEFVIEQAKKNQSGSKDVVINYQSRIISKTGKTRWLESFSKTIIYHGGFADFITVIDITESKLAEQKLTESEEKFRKAYYQANLYRDVFAHDLNNILQNINSSAELSSLYLNNPEKLHTVKELNEITNEQVKRGQKLIDNVRKITEIDESEIQLDKVKIGRHLEKSIEILKTSYQMREINVQVNDNAKKKNVRANGLLLDVFENLLMNAVVHNENPKIEIFIDITMEDMENKKFIKMEFKDNGIGISDFRKKSIFEKGIRKDKRSKGMGLGLSLVKKIMDSYHGKIWVENKVKGDSSKGSNFIVLIPTA
ncbi:hypothetical protein LCGC14_1154030 [marine sediment metagenome]|uniref:histidine kinase n=1 Tax=marine sediment metagenome TaxID=412755 RepID=A0A0F9PCV3_9ZZZZ